MSIQDILNEAIFEQRAPLLAEIVRQGILEGSFTTAYPDKAGEVLLSLLQSMGNTHAKLLLSLDQKRDDDQRLIAEIVTTHAAYMDAVERVSGTPSHSFYRTHAEGVNIWVAARRKKSSYPYL